MIILRTESNNEYKVEWVWRWFRLHGASGSLQPGGYRMGQE